MIYSISSNFNLSMNCWEKNWGGGGGGGGRVEWYFEVLLMDLREAFSELKFNMLLHPFHT